VAGIESNNAVTSAALIIIGDEILTGKVRDENGYVFTKIMFERGVKVERIVVIPDDIATIARFAKEYSLIFDYVCTSGGVPIKEHDDALNYFRIAQINAGRGNVVSDTQKKMLRFPSPCQVFFLSPLWLPLVVVKNVFIFPGVPYLFEKLMTGLACLFEGDRFFREILFTNLSENKIAFDLKSVQDENPDVTIGSYPQMPGKSYSVMISIEGTLETKVHEVVVRLLPLIQGRKTEYV
jgi:molybdopterin-biosynthesis enzyme MoeA-like protein